MLIDNGSYGVTAAPASATMATITKSAMTNQTRQGMCEPRPTRPFDTMAGTFMSI